MLERKSEYLGGESFSLVDATSRRLVDATSLCLVDATSRRVVDATSLSLVDATSRRVVDATSLCLVDATSFSLVDATSLSPVDATSRRVERGGKRPYSDATRTSRPRSCVAKLRGVSAEDFAELTFVNAERILGC